MSNYSCNDVLLSKELSHQEHNREGPTLKSQLSWWRVIEAVHTHLSHSGHSCNCVLPSISSQYLSPPSLGWMMSWAANWPLKCADRHGSEEIPFLKKGNLAKDAVVPGKQEPAEVWLSSLAPGRVCKTRTIPPVPVRKVLLEKSKAREPLREEFITPAVLNHNLLTNLALWFSPWVINVRFRVQTHPSLVALQTVSEGPLEIWLITSLCSPPAFHRRTRKIV